ncbi:hypothetical protein DQ384_38305 [Sphaerisporangium album]|uniref:Schlafen AlbA-2 domain-containing protein n=1 Tax=Sphaerisporangium album TaxID=509200 RepID=A0A367EM39_9ACTN|nr:ATP-binding protein [Sphaerisporangium album]RCG19134.1 hypothetical protein DQ384_38305 [Sphaerisporangium album]
MLYSPRRLETLFGAPLHLVTHQQITSLVGNADAREAEDLDYKRQYDSGDRTKKEKGNDDIAVDIATFANHLGGLIVVGMAEVQEIPSAALGVHLVGLEGRITNAAAARIHPLPRFECRPVPDPNNPNQGFLLIAVPPSALAPHAVSIPSQREQGLRWPRRHGADKVWLSEAEIAASYRRRVMAATDQAARLLEVENDAVLAAAVTSASRQYPLPLLVVTLVPDLPGDLLLDGVKMRAFEESTRDEVAMVGSTLPTFTSASVAHRRLVAEDATDTPYAVRAQLYTDGSGTFAVHPTAITPAGSDNFTVRVLDAEIAARTASALRYMARHARDRAGVNGAALARAMLVADTHLHPAVSPQPEMETLWPFNNPDFVRYRVDLNAATRYAGAERPLGTRVARIAFGEAGVWLDDLADDGQPLAKAAAQLTGDLFQTYGVPENQQIARDGTIRPYAWGSHWETVQKWVVNTGIPLAAD